MAGPEGAWRDKLLLQLFIDCAAATRRGFKSRFIKGELVGCSARGGGLRRAESQPRWHASLKLSPMPQCGFGYAGGSELSPLVRAAAAQSRRIKQPATRREFLHEPVESYTSTEEYTILVPPATLDIRYSIISYLMCEAGLSPPVPHCSRPLVTHFSLQPPRRRAADAFAARLK